MYVFYFILIQVDNIWYFWNKKLGSNNIWNILGKVKYIKIFELN